jgi:glucose/arabinose dehydrogenase
LAYYPGTADLLVSMNQRDDLGARTPGDWLALVRRGDDWRFPRCYGQGGAACAGVRKPIAVLDKHAAAGAVAVLGTSALVPEWSYGRVLRIPLTKAAGGYTGAARPFLTGLRNPLALVTTPAGALLVGDWTTGTIYRVSA